jgi:hypothetical protein
VCELLALGSMRRHTHATLMNEGSSRSHLVLTLHAVLRSEPDGLERRGAATTRRLILALTYP